MPLPDVVSTALAAHLAAYPASPDDLVFRSRTGGLIWPNTFAASVLTPLVKRAGLGRAVRFHDLRHFTASALIRYGRCLNC